MTNGDPEPTPKPPKRDHLDTGIAIAALLAASVLFYATFDSSSSQVNIAAGDAPADLPRILLACWVVLAIIILVRSFLPVGDAHKEPLRLARQFPIIVVLLVTVLAMVVLGYLIPMSVGLVVVIWLLGERRPAVFALAWLILGPGLWALLHHVLQIRLPSILPGGLL